MRVISGFLKGKPIDYLKNSITTLSILTELDVTVSV